MLLISTFYLHNSRILDVKPDKSFLLSFQGERCSSHRLLRSVKNRFGSADEVCSYIKFAPYTNISAAILD
jgi:hypothetical protein